MDWKYTSFDLTSRVQERGKQTWAPRGLELKANGFWEFVVEGVTIAGSSFLHAGRRIGRSL